MRFSWLNHHKDWLNYSDWTDRPGELCYNFSNDLTQIVNFPTWIPDCDSHSPSLLDLLFLSSNTITMAFPPLGNSDHVVVSVSIDFPINSKQDTLFHHVAYDYSCADWNDLCSHLRDVPWEDIFKLSASDATSELMYIYLIVSIKSNLSHLHGFQQLVLLP